MNNVLSREQVYKLIDGERAYQDERWNPDTTASGGLNSPQEWLTYIADYTAEALHAGCREADQTVRPKQMEAIRKIAAMAVAAMEQLGAPDRLVVWKQSKAGGLATKA
jgi:hypothetical protein